MNLCLPSTNLGFGNRPLRTPCLFQSISSNVDRSLTSSPPLASAANVRRLQRFPPLLSASFLRHEYIDSTLLGRY